MSMVTSSALYNQGFPMADSTGRNVGNKMTGNKVPKGFQMGQIQQFTPEQMNLFQSMFGQLGPNSFLSKLAGGDQGMFEQLEAPAMRQFQGLQGDIASRFSGMGMGSRKGSGFSNTLNQATSDFAQDLQSKRMGLQRQALMDLMGMSSDLLQQRPYETFLTEKPKPWWQQLLGTIAGGAAQGLGSGGSLWGMKKLGLF
jgi:hypothetical protein